ncbi:hypothetical protein JZX87_09990 [Agrobacterium sp. Ap1]|uniref:hypothetical protein n=1 Tax=Agrobacterium sp. Ap1 TaxID=2815337 RepID=UPI001A90038C|nr:hypothetical protein [Agrobacterium sp. Ap1]MBO0141492.1 hypothetical protein [Agrobacterium sp. Ap1]
MAERGGKRPGAGRKAGAPNKATAARQEAVASSGLTPLDYMLSILRDETKTVEDRFEAAKAAAPYVHPKLATVDHQSSDGSMSQKPTTIVFRSPEVDGSND